MNAHAATLSEENCAAALRAGGLRSPRCTSAARMARAAAVAIMMLAGCSSPGPDKSPPKTGVFQDSQLIHRFTTVIWPTIMTYRFYGQGDPQTPLKPGSDRDKFNAVIDEAADRDVKFEAEKIGEVLDSKGIAAGETDHVALANTTVASLSESDAAVVACYTYDFTARSEWPHSHDHAVPAASDVTFSLHRGETHEWLVRRISDDHVVPGCPAGTL